MTIVSRRNQRVKIKKEGNLLRNEITSENLQSKECHLFSATKCACFSSMWISVFSLEMLHFFRFETELCYL